MFSYLQSRVRGTAATVPGAPPPGLIAFYWHFVKQTKGLYALMFVTSLTGLLLLVLRDRPAMAPLLVVHLGVVLALFLSLPYGKFVHGFYRTAALVKYAVETAARPDVRSASDTRVT
jgi:hypothetical protein